MNWLMNECQNKAEARCMAKYILEKSGIAYEAVRNNMWYMGFSFRIPEGEGYDENGGACKYPVYVYAKNELMLSFIVSKDTNGTRKITSYPALDENERKMIDDKFAILYSKRLLF